MKRWLKWLIAVVIIVVAFLAVADTLLDRSARRAATNNGEFRDFHDVTGSDLEREVRESLPIGTALSTVENYLSNRGMQFSFDKSTNYIDAAAPYLKGSNLIVRSTMEIQFHFDNAEKLQSINTRVDLTGP
jgi:hypothetical protein